MFDNIMKARAAIVKHAEGKRGVSGQIDCPICKTGKLQYIIAGNNGHIHARCTTDKCVDWME